MKPLRFLILFLILVLPSNLRAETKLSYKIPSNYKQAKVISFAKTLARNNSEILISSIDLNDDFIDEYIVKPASCNKSELCSFSIIALMNDAPVEIGQFNAQEIIILDNKNFGIKQLKIYNKASNDYAQSVAFWDPYQFKYVYK